MTKSLFRKLIIAHFVFFILIFIKLLVFPYSLAPEDLKNAMRMYDEMAPVEDIFSLIMFFVILIGYFYALIQMFRFKKIGIQIFIIVIFLSLISVFSYGYVVYDPLENLIDVISSIIGGFIISASYFSKIKNEFK